MTYYSEGRNESYNFIWSERGQENSDGPILLGKNFQEMSCPWGIEIEVSTYSGFEGMVT